MQQKLYKSEVVENNKLNNKFRLIKLRLTEQCYVFSSGQFITLKVSDSVYRCYSIFSTPKLIPFWEMFVDISPGGLGTKYIESLKNGDFIETLGPSGAFTCKNDTNNNFVFAATGCGLSPVKSMMEELLDSPRQLKMLFLLGLRYEKDFVIEDIMNNWTKKYSNFHYEIFLSHPDNKWKGKRGRINLAITEIAKRFMRNKTSIYLSGNSEFVKENIENLGTINYPTSNIFYESY